LGDGAEVVIIQLLSFRRLGPDERPPAGGEVGAAIVKFFVDEKVFLLVPDGRDDARDVLDAEEIEHAQRLLVERIDGTQERNLRIERFARPRRKGGGDGEVRAVFVLDDERRRGGIPGGVATRLEGGAEAAARERG